MGLLRAYNRQQTGDSKKSRQHVVDSMQGKGNLSTAYCLLSTEKGIALVMVLVLSAIILVIMAGLIYMLTAGTQISGLQKRYKTALEAGMGGADITYQVVDHVLGAGITNPPSPSQLEAEFNFLPAFDITATQTCLTDKLLKSTVNWDATCDRSLTIDPGNINTFDMRFDLGTGPTYTVYAKIADTVGETFGPSGEYKGGANTGPTIDLIQGGVVWSKTESPTTPIPHYYTIEVNVENQNTPERAKLSILYQR